MTVSANRDFLTQSAGFLKVARFQAQIESGCYDLWNKNKLFRTEQSMCQGRPSFLPRFARQRLLMLDKLQRRLFLLLRWGPGERLQIHPPDPAPIRRLVSESLARPLPGLLVNQGVIH